MYSSRARLVAGLSPPVCMHAHMADRAPLLSMLSRASRASVPTPRLTPAAHEQASKQASKQAAEAAAPGSSPCRLNPPPRPKPRGPPTHRHCGRGGWHHAAAAVGGGVGRGPHQRGGVERHVDCRHHLWRHWALQLHGGHARRQRALLPAQQRLQHCVAQRRRVRRRLRHGAGGRAEAGDSARHAVSKPAVRPTHAARNAGKAAWGHEGSASACMDERQPPFALEPRLPTGSKPALPERVGRRVGKWAGSLTLGCGM